MVYPDQPTACFVFVIKSAGVIGHQGKSAYSVDSAT
jgi:hypothetical protein